MLYYRSRYRSLTVSITCIKADLLCEDSQARLRIRWSDIAVKFHTALCNCLKETHFTGNGEKVAVYPCTVNSNICSDIKTYTHMKILFQVTPMECNKTDYYKSNLKILMLWTGGFVYHVRLGACDLYLNILFYYCKARQI